MLLVFYLSNISLSDVRWGDLKGREDGKFEFQKIDALLL